MVITLQQYVENHDGKHATMVDGGEAGVKSKRFHEALVLVRGTVTLRTEDDHEIYSFPCNKKCEVDDEE